MRSYTAHDLYGLWHRIHICPMQARVLCILIDSPSRLYKVYGLSRGCAEETTTKNWHPNKRPQDDCGIGGNGFPTC